MTSIALGVYLLSGLAWSFTPDRVEVAVVGAHFPGMSEPELRAFTSEVVDTVNATGMFKAVGPAEVALRLQGRQELVLSDFSLGRSRDWLDEGRVLSGRFLYHQSIPMLQKATRGLSEGVALTGDVALLAQAWLELGLAHAGQGQFDEARDAFEQVVVLQPERELNPVEHAPKNIALFQEAREEVLGRTTAVLQVTLDSPGRFEVEVDGRNLGPAPVSVGGLPAGRHFLRILGEGAQRTHGSLVLEPGEERVIRAEARQGNLGNTSDTDTGRARQIQALYTAVGRYVATPLVLVAGVRAQGDMVILLYSVESGQFSQSLTSRRGGDGTDALLHLIPALGSYVTDVGGLRVDRVSSEVPAFDVNSNPLLTSLLLEPVVEEGVVSMESPIPRWVVWAGAGTLAAGGAAAVGIALASRSQDDPSGGVIIFGPIP